jgi:DNA invertase Pin-like site-specific DNA recombinase
VNKKAVLYARSSTYSRAGQGQIQLLREAAQRKDLEVVGEYSDVGAPATGLQQVLADARDGKIEVVVVEDLSRLGRDPEASEALSEAGVIVVTGGVIPAAPRCK